MSLLQVGSDTDYGRLSEDGILNQAVVVWVKEELPCNKSWLLKAGLGEENTGV